MSGYQSVSPHPGRGASMGSASRLLPFAWAASALLLLFACSPPTPDSRETVMVLHGLGRSPRSMALIAARLVQAGYQVVTFGYPSTSEPIEVLVDSLGSALDECCSSDPNGVHFVTHSLGGVLVRSYLSARPAAHEGRVVMLSPPSQGSEIIDAFADSPMLRSFLGPSSSQLGTDSTGIATKLGPVTFSLGIITGDRSLNPIGSWLIPGPDDGKVGVERARVEGAADFLVMPATHTFIMNRRDVADETVHFLQHGRFTGEGG